MGDAGEGMGQKIKMMTKVLSVPQKGLARFHFHFSVTLYLDQRRHYHLSFEHCSLCAIKPNGGNKRSLKNTCPHPDRQGAVLTGRKAANR